MSKGWLLDLYFYFLTPLEPRTLQQIPAGLSDDLIHLPGLNYSLKKKERERPTLADILAHISFFPHLPK